MSVNFQLKIPHIYDNLLWCNKKSLFWVEAETCCFCACLFKFKWAAAPRPFFQDRAVALQLTSDALVKNMCLVLIIVSITLKTCMCLTQASVHQQTWAGPVNVTSLFTDSTNGLFWETVYDLWGLKKEQVDLYHYRVVVYTHCQHTFMFKQQVHFL